MRGQRGQTLVLVLILLGVGSLVLVPALRYISTALLGLRVSTDAANQQTSAAAGVEDARWRLAYDIPPPGFPDGLLTSVTPSTPRTYSLPINGIEVEITVEALEMTESATAPTVKKPGSSMFVSMTRSPSWVPLGGETTYSVRAYNDGTARVFLRELHFCLPPGFVYAFNLGGILLEPLEETWYLNPSPHGHCAPGRQEIFWKWTGSGHPVDAKGPNDPEFPSGTATFNGQAPTVPEAGGIYYNKSWAVFRAQGQQNDAEQASAPTAATSTAMYKVEVSAGNYSVWASMGLSGTNTVTLYSYQVQ